MRHVGVLVLIDENVTESLLVLGEHGGIPAENREIVQQEVAEIGGVEFRKPRLVLAIEFDRAAIGELAGLVARDLVRH